MADDQDMAVEHSGVGMPATLSDRLIMNWR
jgi:hypothetical protein